MEPIQDDLQRRIKELEARGYPLRREDHYMPMPRDHYNAMLARLQSLEAERDRLREALTYVTSLLPTETLLTLDAALATPAEEVRPTT